jgi:hypothetical protein
MNGFKKCYVNKYAVVTWECVYEGTPSVEEDDVCPLGWKKLIMAL